MLYLISYDLDEPGPHNYVRIEKELGELGGKEILYSQWVIRSNLTAKDLRKRLKGFINKDTDALLVCELTANRAGWRLKAKLKDL